MTSRKLTDKLVSRESIKEVLTKVKQSDVDYVTPSGKVYCDYGNNMFYPKAVFVNKHNGYCYVSIKTPQGQIQRRLHKLVAETLIPNPNNLPIVMHLDNNKKNCSVSNLKWGTVSENTKQAFDDGLAHNDKGFEDSQSMPVCQFNIDKELINTFGSVSIAYENTGITKTGILYQCNHKVRTKNRKPKCGSYFRFLSEYQKCGFVL